ncbi:MAG TPA: VCBS repeat-containing protein [Polyangiales bacterium]|nr:VCBS repeat-containing protein [Polyangiales bacterium]
MRVNEFGRLAGAIALVSFVSGCGGGGDAGGTGGTPTGDEVRDKLVALGVNVEETPRLDDDAAPLPDDYSPFGSSRSFDTIDEVLLVGPQFENSDSLVSIYELQSQNDRPIYAKENIFNPTASETPWAPSVGETPANLRAVAAADIDGDGLDEVAVLYREGSAGDVLLQTYQENTNGGVISFAPDQVVTITIAQGVPTALSLVAGDFNGDGFSEFAAGLSFADQAIVLYVDNEEGSLSIASQLKSLPQAVANSSIQLSMATGNLDYDAGNELVVVVNESFLSSGVEDGAARYFIFDDAKADYASVEDGLIRATLAEVNRTAIVADVATGDIDGDNVDEIVFGGLQGFDPSGVCGYRYLLVALDDIKRDTVPLGGLDLVPSIHGGCAAGAPGALRYVHVNVLDLDGDKLPEIQANQYVFEDFVNADPWTQYQWGFDENDQPLYAVIDDASLFASAEGFTGRFALDNSTMMAADVTADGRQNVVFYSQATNRLETWGLSNPDAGDPPLSEPIFDRDWRLMNALTVQDPGPDPVRPIILDSNINYDSFAVRFSEGDYKLIFTEPIIIAALAAAPCAEGLGQNPDACRTSFGTASSTTVSEEQVYSIRASASVGFETEFSALGVKVSGVEVIGTLQGRASDITSNAYSVTKRIVYTTGPIEDTVIFTTIPLDQYTYEITSHPDPELIGSKVVISLPREPIEVQVERERYNANVVSGGPIIDERVLGHMPGVLSSYPTAPEKDALLSEFVGYDFGPAAVGNSGGSSSLAINVATESGDGTTYGVDFDLNVKGTIGTVVAGFGVGFSSDKTVQIIHGEESEYTGTVSDMDLPTDEFGQNRYSWGIFTYLFDDPVSAQQYEIVNFWVE